jgi:hypothetical protein
MMKKNTKTMKNDEQERTKQEQMMKKSEKTMKHDKKERKQQ